jgi:hypothetical protein
MHTPASAVSLQTVHSCTPLAITIHPLPPRPLRGSETHRLGTNNLARNLCVYNTQIGRSHTRIPHYAFIAQPSNLLSLCEQLWILLTGLRPVSKQPLIYYQNTVLGLTAIISTRPQLFCRIIRSLSSLALRTSQTAPA